jgi:hypothetical protein
VIDAKVLLPNGMPLPVVLLGNKCDIDTAEIDKSQLDKFVAEHKFVVRYKGDDLSQYLYRDVINHMREGLV